MASGRKQNAGNEMGISQQEIATKELET